jgi:5-methylcytosine-specific restriction protein B
MEVIFMKENEIKNGIQLICDLSKETARYYNNKNALIDRLNNVDKKHLAILEYEFKSKTGPVNDLRKEMLEHLLKGNKLDGQTFEKLIRKYRTGDETKFKLFSEFLMFQQFLAPHEHKVIEDFVNQFKNEIINRLQLKGKVKHRYIDFQGRPHQGIEKFSLAIYDIRQDSKSKPLQFLVEFQDCSITYGVKRQLNKNYTKEPEIRSSVNFNFEALISFFEQNKGLILKDEL